MYTVQNIWQVESLKHLQGWQGILGNTALADWAKQDSQYYQTKRSNNNTS